MLATNIALKFTHPSLLAPETVSTISFDQTEPKVNPSAPTPDAIVDRLVQGNQKFVQMRGQTQQASVRLSAVAQGQKSFAAILNYAHLTTSPEELFSQKFGDLFTINSPGQLINSHEVGGIEYSVLMQGIAVVIVLGDTLESQPAVIDQSIDRLTVAVKRNKILVTGRTPQPQADPQTDILNRVARLKASPLLARLIQAGNLKIVGGLHDAAQGTVTILD